MVDINKIEQNLGISFQNPQLLKQAFTHSSYVNEHPDKKLADNERLEFLGDAVLELAVSQYLYQQDQEKSEGELTKLRAAIVQEESLYNFAKSLQLNDYLLLGKGEELTGGRTRPSLLADAFEAFLGALYLDQGYHAVRMFLEKNIFPKIQTGAFSHAMDYKTKLQEVVQQHKNMTITYQIVEEKGPSHNKEFSVQVKINEEVYGVGHGRTKKDAEQLAAKHALDIFNKQA